MKIIGGDAKRRSLKVPPPSTGVRPILARIRKSLFDILRPRLEAARFLDMYAGSGAVGLEALSRGASHVVFLDQNGACLRVIHSNVMALGFSSKAHVVKGDATKSFGTYPAFDLIFMGPPYHDAKPLSPKDLDQRWNAFHLTGPTLVNIAREKYLAPGGWVIAQHHAKERPVNDAGWKMFRQEKYGDTRLSFFEEVTGS